MAWESSPPSRTRILVVEDEPSIADNIVYALESEGFMPQVSATGSDALKKFEQNEWALVILDVGLPDLSGFEVCRRMLASKNVPVIFLTARGQEVDRVVGLELGADDYVVKPFSPRELTARVRAVLRRAGGRSESAPQMSANANSAAPLVVDGERCVVRYYGQTLQLPRYEFRLLQALAAHPGRVFTRSQLMDRASDEPEAAMERTVDAHVKSLRAALKTVKPDVDPIQTHRGMGYSLIEDWSAIMK
ncbi:MAG: two-component system response regulator CreB [Verrucomicrobiaceae bacterium]|nr:two-component system response regulator CreB [Verrucomicrobiaceae bacterium]